ncbi:hypothetical protein Pyrfu_0425 [Pyrolobus fumarii 1A]|uniref:Uncharacterized protein n=1 Tax=Pyrolobus fumarii (strain DSM 11204 / 1A) TaxID=694429 RepID=G0EG48_PYRF1|nr:hypothetical protein [Pyrolobus fumarii]AEM38296.1 hypothetical protein Pyrfu_0425 [Pyrolobus fumarii 1A]
MSAIYSDLLDMLGKLCRRKCDIWDTACISELVKCWFIECLESVGDGRYNVSDKPGCEAGGYTVFQRLLEVIDRATYANIITEVGELADLHRRAINVRLAHLDGLASLTSWSLVLFFTLEWDSLPAVSRKRRVFYLETGPVKLISSCKRSLLEPGRSAPKMLECRVEARSDATLAYMNVTTSSFIWGPRSLNDVKLVMRDARRAGDALDALGALTRLLLCKLEVSEIKELMLEAILSTPYVEIRLGRGGRLSAWYIHTFTGLSEAAGHPRYLEQLKELDEHAKNILRELERVTTMACKT